MAVSLIDFVLPEILSSRDVVHAGKLGGEWSVSHSGSPKTRKDNAAPFKICFDKNGAADGVHVALKEKIKWLRLEVEIPASDIAKSVHKFCLYYKCLGLVAGCGPQVKIIEYCNGVGETFCKISNSLARSSSTRLINNMIEIPHEGLPHATYRLCFEFKEPVDFWLSGIDLFNLERSYSTKSTARQMAPFQVYDFQISAALKELNGNMDAMMHKSPLTWVKDMLRVALSMEDYETASGLVRYLENNFSEDPKLLEVAGDLILNTKIAIGETDAAQELIIRSSAEKRPSDNSIVVARALQTRSQPHQQYDLPSGKSDIFNLSKDLLSYPDVEFESVFRNAPNSSEHHLLWANYLLHRSETEYLKQINSYLKATNSPFEIELTGAHDNILERVVFHATRPLVLPSDGPLVSVIIAAYRAEDTIEYAINSILNQTYKNIEVLICDDGSDDNTKLVLQKFAGDPRVRTFESAANQGPYNIRNWMISKSNGEVITFHDSDDVALPHRIAAQLQKMIADKKLVVLGQWIRIRENGHLVAFKDGTYRRNCLNSIMFTRGFFEKHGPYRDVVCAADSEFYEMLRGQVAKKDISILQQPLVLGLWGAGSLTRTSGLEADELGYRATSRRSYIAAAARQRILGKHIVTDDMVRETAKKSGIYRAQQAVTALKIEDY